MPYFAQLRPHRRSVVQRGPVFNPLDGRVRSLCEKQRSLTIPETLRQLIMSINIDYVIALAGIAIFATWLLQTSLGRRSLADSQPRRNSMAPYVPFIPFIVWFFGVFLIQSVVDSFVRPVEGQQKVFQDQAVYCIAAMLTVVGLILPLARFHFARGLHGFGLRLRALPRDLGAAFVNLFAVWPLVLGAIMVTTAAARWVSLWVWGQDFEMPQHTALKEMTEDPAVALQILLIVLAVVVAPLTEEMIFRGLFQTMLRSYLGQPWPAIVVTSVLFAMVHGDLAHWPALFVLALGLGYAYEKSGSLFRPIFMHALFNGVAVASTLAG